MMDHTMAHELIHAYDQCRVKLERSNCLHVACTEVNKLIEMCTGYLELLEGRVQILCRGRHGLSNRKSPSTSIGRCIFCLNYPPHTRHAGARLLAMFLYPMPCFPLGNSLGKRMDELAEHSLRHLGVSASSICQSSTTIMFASRPGRYVLYLNDLLLGCDVTRVKTHRVPPTPDPCLQHQRGVLLQHGSPTGALEVGGAAKGVRQAASGAVAQGDPGL